MLTSFDIDGVLGNCADAINAFHNRMFGTSLKYDDITHYDLWRAWKCSREEGVRRTEMFFDSHYFDEMLPYLEIKKVVSGYAKKGRNITTTSRPLRTETRSNDWVKRCFPKEFYAHHHTGDGYRDGGGCVYPSKAVACKELGVDLHVEDCVETSVEVASAGTDVMLIDRPWNRYLPPGVTKLPDNIFRIFL